MTQSCTEQYEWYTKALAAVPADDWLIIVGHHPLDQLDEEDFVTPTQAHGFAIYYNGHVHTLAAGQIDDKNVYITSGAGSMVQTADQSHESVHERLMSSAGQTVSSSYGHTSQTLFNEVVAGFAQSTFSSDFTTLQTTLISTSGKHVYTVTVDRSGAIVA
jgi:hypothetical protein